jgi:hypothetical protein
MDIKKPLASAAFAAGVFASMSAYAWGIQENHSSAVVEWNGATTPMRPATKPHVIVLAQLSPQQLAQCQAERAQLNQQISQCADNACRAQLQAAVAAHNARCSR